MRLSGAALPGETYEDEGKSDHRGIRKGPSVEIVYYSMHATAQSGDDNTVACPVAGCVLSQPWLPHAYCDVDTVSSIRGLWL